jgi:hypothetical protein
MRDEAGRVSGAGSLQKHCAARAKRQPSKSTRVVIQPTMIVRAIFGEGPRLGRKADIEIAWWDVGFRVRSGIRFTQI